MKKKSTVIETTKADENHAVVSIEGAAGHMQRPCKECPWRKDNAGSFPAEAFRISARTAQDAAFSTFGCHMSGTCNSKTCAGFLLSKSAQDNVGVRMMQLREPLRVSGEGCDLFETYRQMAEANGVPKNDPALDGCMPEARMNFTRTRRAAKSVLP